MTTDAARYDDREDTPLGGYAALASVFVAGTGTFALVARRRGVRLPENVPPWDVLLMGTAAYKASRLVTKDKITSFLRAPFTRRAEEGEASEVMDEATGTGLRRAVGDLVSCPFCTAAWATGALVCTYAASPRLTRLVGAGFAALTVADWLQYAWTATQRIAED
ncbi:MULTISPECIES: DUF1360 domain-containing protein [unclassified Streptomyces]|jgi:hypothetical protein|uniref:DUF1360 domain-containing protein n=1 Tax=unclassified Streptomyces TaxID=2593676 RepID=UPI0029672659|nr:DUF1360 domain-containing protein [Streptomyces sp. SCL15-4]